MQAPIKHDEVKANVMKRWGLVIFFSAVLMGHAEAGPSALALGYCASDFDVCYTNCRISNPDPSFIGDRARVICGQSCFQQRQQCEARAGGMVRSAPSPIAPLPSGAQPVPQQARPARQPAPIPGCYARPGTVQRAPVGAAGSAPPPGYAPAKTESRTQTKTQTKPEAKAEQRESGILGWFKRPDRTRSIIPGK